MTGFRAVLAVVWLAWAAWAACAWSGDAGGAWRKAATQEVLFRALDHVLSPGLFDPELQRIIQIPPDGKPMAIELPHAGALPNGLPRPALKGAFKQGFVWLDLNGNGRQDPRETAAVKPGVEAGPFAYTAYYDDGTSGVYRFKLRYLGGPGRFQLFRAMAKQARIGGHQVLFLDENGNGRYDDLGKDAVLVMGRPITLLSRQLYLGNQLHELLVHPAGQTVEVRPLKGLRFGEVDLFRLFKPAQKTTVLQVHTVIIAGREGAFSFENKKYRRLKVPAGAYDIVFGLLQRGKERVMVKRGERTSFNVAPGKIATPAWGAPIQGVVTMDSDGQKITVRPPVFMGEGSEIYVPVDWKKIPLHAFLSFIWRDRFYNNAERFDLTGTSRYKVAPSGQLEPVTFKPASTNPYRVVVEYKSGVLGVVRAKERINFIAKKR